MKLKLATLVVLLSAFAYGQPKALTQKEACKQSMSAVVRIDVAGGQATGFIVSPDGWVMTAGHVVFDQQTGQQLTSIAIRLPDGSTSFGRPVVDRESVIRDFALLKIEGSNLPHLDLGDESEVEVGSEITIIGYPFSAESAYSPSIATKFCLSGMITATDSITEQGINVHAIYFQGPAVKGVSGGPIVSRPLARVS